jgi:putative transposase
VEVLYEQPLTPTDVDSARVVAIDIGVNILAAVASNQPGLTPLLVNGRPLKALNQWYKKRRAHLQAKLPDGIFVSRQLDLLTDKRQRRQITSYLHVASRCIVNWLVAQRIGTLVIGKNDNWKQRVQMGRRANQNLRLHSARPLYPDAPIQSGTPRHPSHSERAELYLQM